MGPSYAGILGPIAFVSMIVRGLVSGSSASNVLINSSVCLLIFAAIGYVAGRIADQIVLESVKLQFGNELKAGESAEKNSQLASTEGTRA